MLFRTDASSANDDAIAALLRLRNLWSDSQTLRFTSEQTAAMRLRRILESEGRVGEFRTVSIEGKTGFFYICRISGAPFHSPPFAVGVGETEELAVCDAFLHCCTRG